jgi:hypothetical protein
MTYLHFAHQKSHIQYTGIEQVCPWRKMTNNMGYKADFVIRKETGLNVVKK